MNIKLSSEEQRRHYDSVKWLLTPGPRREVKTYLMASVFLEIALKNLGDKIYLLDHYPADGLSNIKDKISMIFLDEENDFTRRYKLYVKDDYIVMRYKE